MVDLSEVRDGDHVEISLSSDSSKRSEGKVETVLKTSEPSVVVVLLTSGDHGLVIKKTDSEETIKERIMHESHYSENKENFSEDIMRNDSIPKTIQSFLNSMGGHLYIGIKDQGSLKERLVGLEHDFDSIRENNKNISNDKLCDMLEIEIINSLSKHLQSEIDIGPLIRINFPIICNVQILEIAVKSSSKPWFFKHTTRQGKPKQFGIYFNGKLVTERILDDFYIRRGNQKILLQTQEDFYNYLKSHYK